MVACVMHGAATYAAVSEADANETAAPVFRRGLNMEPDQITLQARLARLRAAETEETMPSDFPDRELIEVEIEMEVEQSLPRFVESDEPPLLILCGEPLNLVSGVAGSVRRFILDIPPETDRLEARMQGGDGDADLYARWGKRPDLIVFDHRPYVMGNAEAIVVERPEPGAWHLMVHGADAYTNVTLLVLCFEEPAESQPESARVSRDMELAMYYEFSGLTDSEHMIRNPELRYRTLRDEGRNAFNAGDYPGALDRWTYWSQLDPSNPEPVSLIGDTYLRMGHLDEAIEYYRRSLSIQPGQVTLMVRLARLLDVEAGDPIQARDLLNFHERLFPGHTTILLAKAEWLLRRKRNDEAGALIRRVIEDDPDNLRALTLLHGLLKTPMERFENMKTMVAVGGRVGAEHTLARAISDNHLLTRPESWALMDFVERMAYHAPNPADRLVFSLLRPRDTIAVEDFRIGRISRSWISSHDRMWNEDGSFMLTADRSHTEAYLRLDGSDALRNGFIEAEVEHTRGFFWLYARRGEGNMIRFGFDENGLMYQQIWLHGRLHSNQTRLWSKPDGPSTFRLAIRGDGVFTSVDGEPAFSAPLSIPRDMGVGWWGLAPWAPEPGVAAASIHRIAGGPYPVRVGLLDYEALPARSSEQVERLKERIGACSAVAPYWYRESPDGRMAPLPFSGDREVRLLSRFYRARLMPIVRLRNPFAPDWDRLVELVHGELLDGLTLVMPKMPSPEWIEQAERHAVRTDMAVNLLLFEPNGQSALLREIAPGGGLFAGARRARRLPIVEAFKPTDEAIHPDVILRL